LALFLAGMDQMSAGLKAAAGDSLRDVMAKLTKNRVMGAVTGAFVTAVLNSSSVTTVLVVGFISAGIMTMAQSVSVIMGANIGSTVTAQIVAFNVTQYALLMVAVGFGMQFIGSGEKGKHYGAMVMGLGLVFFGMGVMSEAMNPLRSYAPFLDLMVKMENPILGILVGALFTGLVQSSAATTGIAIVMASEGLMSLPAGIALAFGANIGTCVTAILAAIGKPREAVRAAVAHILFNVVGVLIWVFLIPQLADVVVWLSPAYANLQGTERMAAEVPRQIANAHTVFNVANTLLFLGFTTQFARLVTWLVPDRPVEERVIITPKYLDRELLTAPSLALQRVRLELGRLGEIVHDMLSRLPDAFMSGRYEPLEEIEQMDDQVDVLEGAILGYLAEIRQRPLNEEESQELYALMSATDNLESIGDIIETDLVALGRKKLELGLEASETIRHSFIELHAALVLVVDSAVRAVRDNDQKAAQEVLTMKDEIHRQVEGVLKYQASALDVTAPEKLSMFRMEMEAVDKLKRIYALAKRITRAILPRDIAWKAAE
jgi:phosphate:Na+ symporter